MYSLRKKNEDRCIVEQYEIANTDDSWTVLGERYLSVNLEIGMEVSTTGKYIAGRLREM